MSHRCAHRAIFSGNSKTARAARYFLHLTTTKEQTAILAHFSKWWLPNSRRQTAIVLGCCCLSFTLRNCSEERRNVKPRFTSLRVPRDFFLETRKQREPRVPLSNRICQRSRKVTGAKISKIRSQNWCEEYTQVLGRLLHS